RNNAALVAAIKSNRPQLGYEQSQNGRTTMLRSLLIRSGFLAVLLVFAAGTSTAQEFKARLSGFFEIGALNNNTGAILTPGTGKFTLDADVVTVRLPAG